MTNLADLNVGSGEKTPAFAYKVIGSAVKIRVTDSRVITTPNLNTGADEQKLVVTGEMVSNKEAIFTFKAEGDAKAKPVEVKPGEIVSVWLKMTPSQVGALTAAVKAAKNGSATIDEGDIITVQYKEDKEVGKVQPMKVLAFKVEPAKKVASMDLEDI